MLEESAKKEFTDVDTNNPNCVLVGLSPSSFHYEKLDQAFKLGNFVGIYISYHNINVICSNEWG